MSNGPSPNWAQIAPRLTVETTSVLLTECEGCLIIDAIHTVTTYTVGNGLGNVYDPDDGLPLSYAGERSYGDGRLFPSSAAAVADAFQGRLDVTVVPTPAKW